MAIYQLPGSNAVQTAAAVNARMKELSATFPAGINYDSARHDQGRDCRHP